MTDRLIKLAQVFLTFVALFALTGCGKVYLPSLPIPSPTRDHIASSSPKDTRYGGRHEVRAPHDATRARPYTVLGKTYHPYASADGFVEEGLASWYGHDFHGKKTANGERYNMYGVSAAHKLLPLDTKVRVTNLENGRQVVLRVNDRGPFVGDRIIDLSYGAAKKLGTVEKGVARVRVEAVGSQAPRQLRSNTRLASSQPVRSSGRVYIQVGAYSRADNARKVHGELMRNGFKGSRIETVRRSGRDIHVVKAGAFPHERSARSALNLLQRHYPGCFISS